MNYFLIQIGMSRISEHLRERAGTINCIAHPKFCLSIQNILGAWKSCFEWNKTAPFIAFTVSPKRTTYRLSLHCKVLFTHWRLLTFSRVRTHTRDRCLKSPNRPTTFETFSQHIYNTPMLLGIIKTVSQTCLPKVEVT